MTMMMMMRRMGLYGDDDDVTSYALALLLKDVYE
jgi:hypothetical protein